MTSIDTTTLQAIASASFEDFEGAWITGGTTGNDVASRYYRELKQQGIASGNQNIVDYAELAGYVAGYSGVNGVLANEYSQAVAEKYGVDFSVGSDNWLRMQYELMKNDVNARINEKMNGRTGELNFNDILTIHSIAFGDIGLPPETFSLYTPLSQVAQYDPAKAQAMFASILPGNGLLDILEDGLTLGFGTGVSTQQDIGAILRDYGDQAGWLGVSLQALENLATGIGYPGDLSDVTSLLDKYEALASLAGVSFDGLADWADQLKQLADDYGWALNNPDAILGELPDWFLDALSPLVETPGRPDDTMPVPVSPLVLDIDGDGSINLVSLETSGVSFDFWSDGFAERTGWVAPGDGFLVRDVDNDGAIEGVAEMFGSNYPLGYLLSNDWPTLRDTENGFAKLELLDSNADGIVSGLDTAWSTLKIWQDANQDGASQPGELKTLGSLNIASIDVAGAELDSWYGLLGGGFRRKIEGNTITHTSSFTLNNGTSREIVDAWFALDLMNSRLSEDYTLDVRTLFLPTLRGYGTLPDLHVAMSRNTALLDKVSAFATAHANLTGLFADFAAVRTSAADILKTWAGITGPEAGYDHGAFGKMPEYLFLRKFSGMDSPYLGSWFDTNDYMPWPADGVSAIFQTWNNVLDGLTARLLFQSGAQEIFQSGVSYNPSTDTFDGVFRLDQAAITALKTTAATQTDKEGFWHSVAVFVDDTIGRANLTTTETGWLADAVSVSSGGALNWPAILHTLDLNAISGTDGNDSRNGTRWNDVMGESSPTGGNDSFYGKDGDDILYGGEGNDYLSGGKGNDILYGGIGNDVYYYDFGHDVVVEFGGNYYLDTDVIRFSAGIAQSAVTLHMAGMGQDFTGHLFLEVAGRGTIIIQDDGAWWSPNSELIDRLEFASGVQVTIQQSDISIHGTQDDDSLGGMGYSGLNKIYGYGGNDYIWSNNSEINSLLDGGEGDDTFSIGGGNDIYVFSPGTDIVEDFGGADTILLPEGYTLDDVRFLRTEGSGAYYNATLVVEGLGSMVLKNQFASHLTGRSLETLVLADGTSVDLMSRPYEIEGTDGDDSFQVDGLSGSQSENNIYRFGKGQDALLDDSGHDTLLFSAGVTASDITFYRTSGSTPFQTWPYGEYDLVIKDSQGNSFTVVHHFYGAGSPNALETLLFADGTTIDLLNIEIEARGTEGNDQIQGVSVGDLSPNDTIYGYGGIDSLAGEDGDDFLDGGNGDDRLYGGDGNDTLYGRSGNDWLYGQAGNDLLDGGDGDDRLYGGDGTDTISYLTASAAVTVNMALMSAYTSQNTGGGGIDILSDFENLTGSAFGDTLTGDSGDNVINGGAGNDVINGGAGTDTASYSGASAGVTVNLSLTTAQNTVGAGTDTLSEFENLTGSSYSDTLTGNSGANVMEGGSGNDTLNGSGGNDILYGDAGNDLITGGSGIDILYGNDGADRFKFVVSGMDGSVDTISDFSLAQSDKLYIKDLLIGFDPLTKLITDFVQISDSSGNSLLKIDRDGTAGAYGMTQIATLQGVTGLTDEAALLASGHIVAA